MIKYLTHCRLCGSRRLSPCLTLTPTPPANEFVSMECLSTVQDTFPLDLLQCWDCAHVQLSCVVDPARLFRNYVYVSGTSPSFVNHFKLQAAALVKEFAVQPGSLVVDIGSNDGTLLKQFKSLGMNVLGFDPAEKIASAATAEGVETIPEFFNTKTATKVPGRAALVTACNVFAHADDLGGLVDAVKAILEPRRGIFSFEVSYLPDVIQNLLFDTIYHEHTSYHHLIPLMGFFQRLGMKVVRAEKISTHGGSLRVMVAMEESEIQVDYHQLSTLIHNELQMGLGPAGNSNVFQNLKNRIDNLKNNLYFKLNGLKKGGKRVAAFGAPAKATTLMYHFGIDQNLVNFIIDDSPLKQGLFSPGKHMAVLPSSSLFFDGELTVDYCLILAWNFADVIIKNNTKFSAAGGKWIVPIPELKEI